MGYMTICMSLISFICMLYVSIQKLQTICYQITLLRNITLSCMTLLQLVLHNTSLIRILAILEIWKTSMTLIAPPERPALCGKTIASRL